MIGLDYTSNPDVNKKWEDVAKRKRKKLTGTWRYQFDQFTSLENDDCVLVLDGQRHLLGIGLVEDPPSYQFRPELRNFFRHVRKVRWLLACEWENRVPIRVPGFRNTIVRADKDSKYWQLVHYDFALHRLIPSGARKRATRRTEELAKKYGPGGEGTAHRKLKNWVFNHPEMIDLDDVVGRHQEYKFRSGDRADILFDLSGSRHAVVEIETDNPDPGVFQALKYKVLKCAQLGIDLESRRVEPILVAWRKPENMRVCQKYGIRFVRRRR